MKNSKTKKAKVEKDDLADKVPSGADEKDRFGVVSDAPASPSDDPTAMCARIDSLEDALARAKADYQNLRRRSTIEQSNALQYANAELMRSLLVVIDDFERSLTAASEDAEPTAVVEGLQLVHDNFVRALTSHGLEVFDAMHETFDPSVHEAMMQQPTTEFDPGTVIGQIAKGYRLGDRVIRPAKVIVATAPPNDPSDDAPPAVQDAQEANTE